MEVSVLREYKMTPQQLSTMVVSVLHEYDVTPPQLSTMVVSFFDKSSKIPTLLKKKKKMVLNVDGVWNVTVTFLVGNNMVNLLGPPKASMVSRMMQLSPPCPQWW